MTGVARIGALEILGPTHDNLHGHPALHCQSNRGRLDRRRVLPAKTTTDLGRNYPDLYQRQLEDSGNRRSYRELGLRRHPDRHLTGRIDFGQDCVRLDVSLVHHRDEEAMLKNPVGLLKAPFRIPIDGLRMETYVSLSTLNHRQRSIFLIVLVNQRRPLTHGLKGIGQGGQNLVIDLYKFKGLLSRFLVHGRHSGNFVSYGPDLGAGEILLVADEPSINIFWKVLCGDDRFDPFEALCPLRIDLLDPGVGVGASQDLPEQKGTAKTNIGPEYRLTRDLLQNLYSRKFLTYDFHCSFAASSIASTIAP